MLRNKPRKPGSVLAIQALENPSLYNNYKVGKELLRFKYLIDLSLWVSYLNSQSLNVLICEMVINNKACLVWLSWGKNEIMFTTMQGTQKKTIIVLIIILLYENKYRAEDNMWLINNRQNLNSTDLPTL